MWARQQTSDSCRLPPTWLERNLCQVLCSSLRLTSCTLARNRNNISPALPIPPLPAHPTPHQRIAACEASSIYLSLTALLNRPPSAAAMLLSQLSRCSKRLASGSSARAFSSAAPQSAPRTALITKRRELGVSSYNAFTAQHRQYAQAAERTDQGVDPSDSFLTGNTAGYVDEMYSEWQRDPSSVHVSWQHYFKNVRTSSFTGNEAHRQVLMLYYSDGIWRHACF